MKSTTFAVYVLWEYAVQLQLELLCVYRQDFGLGHVPGSVDVVLFCLFFFLKEFNCNADYDWSRTQMLLLFSLV